MDEPGSRFSLKALASSFVIFLFVAAHPSLEAQEGDLVGTVRAEDTGSALANVSVEVLREDGTRAARSMTGTGGTFRITDVPAGVYDVVFFTPGWERTTRTGVEIRPAETITLEVMLSPLRFTLDPLTVTAGRREQRALEAPASLSVISREEVEERQAITPMDYVDGEAGVDVIRSGLQQGYVVARGFNNVFSGSMLQLTDNRIARVPSLRANIQHLDPTTSADIDRIEVVLGPGSALYGPNAASGVLHVMTKSPIDDPGGSFSFAVGPREQGADFVGQPTEVASSTEAVISAEGRVAHRFSDELGLKVSGSYFEGTDFRFIDPDEFANQQIAGACLGFFDLDLNEACQVFAEFEEGQVVPPDPERLERIGARDFDLERWSIDTRLDWRPEAETEVIFSYGRTEAVNSIDLTGIGAAQVDDWTSQYAQVQFSHGDLFVQGFGNWSRAGDTFILSTGQPIEDTSWIGVGQVQHQSTLGERQRFIYGVDYIRTQPNTNESIHGIHEDDDDTDEVGLYLQSETALGDRWEFVAAARGDYHSLLDKVIFSPRGALVFKPEDGHNLRLTFNRAFSTPSSVNFFLDIQSRRIPLGGGFSYGLQAQGTFDRGFSFQQDQGGRPMMKSPFAPAAIGGPDQFLPARTPVLWDLAVGVIAAQDPQAGAMLQDLDTPTEEQVAVVLGVLDPGAGEFLPFPGFGALDDIPAIEEQTTNTLELGYKGLVDEGRLLLSADVWWSRVENFIGPLRVETPNTFLNGEDLAGFMIAQGVDPETAAQLAQQMAQIPVGVVTPTEVAPGGANLLLTYRNFGNVDLFGADVSATYQPTERWTLGLALSVVDDDIFTTDDDQIVHLNASTFKTRTSVGYRNEDVGFFGRAAWRFVDGFPAASGVFVGEVSDYNVTDLTLGYRIPGFQNLTLQVDVQNLFDQDYRTFPGSPQLGRFTMARVRYEF